MISQRLESSSVITQSKVDLQTVIFTRFNMPLAFGGKVSSKIIESEWLRYRTGLFRNYCYPSISQQSTQDFTWLTLFDPRTPQWLLDTFESEFPRTIPILTDAFHIAERTEVVNSHCPPSEMLLTANIDSDDCLHRDYVKRLLAGVNEHGQGFLNFRNGLTMQGGRCYRIAYPSNGFVALSEPRESAKMVMFVPHNEAIQTGPYHELNCEPMWMQVIHGDNYSNDLFGIRQFHVNFADFGVKPDANWPRLGPVPSLVEASGCLLRNLSRRTQIKARLKRLLGR